MKYLPLVLAGLWCKPARTIFTFLSIAVAFILFGILSGIDEGFAHQLEIARLDRLYTYPAFGGNRIPTLYADKIAIIPGVVAAAPRAGLNGYYRDPKNGLSIGMIDKRYLIVHPEIAISQTQIADLFRTYDGVSVGTAIAKRYGWKVGDRIAINTNIPNKGGNAVWSFQIVSITGDTDNPDDALHMIGNIRYANEYRTKNIATCGQIHIKTANAALGPVVARAIDAMFENSPAPTLTQVEKEGAESGLQSLGDVRFLTRAVTSAVLFMLLFLTGNTMMQSIRERTPEFGVLKTLGYTDQFVLGLVLCEAVILCALAGAGGLLIVRLGFGLVKGLVPDVSSLLRLPPRALAIGFLYSLGVAFISGIIPAIRIKRLNVVDALRAR